MTSVYSTTHNRTAFLLIRTTESTDYIILTLNAFDILRTISSHCRQPHHHHLHIILPQISTHLQLNLTLQTLPSTLSIPLSISTSTHNREFPRVSRAIRVEFARGDGRIKRKEDDRRKNIQPNETLFVVNFSEETTKREDLEMLFSKFGELVRIDMKRNYAFVQFTNIEDSTKARNATNGGKLDQNVITVECKFVMLDFVSD
jgi:hypothetical protein